MVFSTKSYISSIDKTKHQISNVNIHNQNITGNDHIGCSFDSVTKRHNLSTKTERTKLELVAKIFEIIFINAVQSKNFLICQKGEIFR